jgi:hypothetical protein
MAFDSNNSRFLLWLISKGERLGDTVTIGRLGVFLPKGTFESDAAKLGIRPPEQGWAPILRSPFCDPILSALGANSVSSLDFSDYEGANLIHDLNKPIPDSLHERFDLLFDSGSLEHVFNVPAALRNYVHLVRKGGLLVLDLPIDGCSGHGFYQFSPELFYRYFSSETGCRVEAMFCVENLPGSMWYRVPNPAEINRRIEIESPLPVHLLILIRRVEIVESIPEHFPSQADYETAWSEKQHKGDGHSCKPAPGNSPIRRKKWLRASLGKLFGMSYHRFSVHRNARRGRKDFRLGKSPFLPPFDPFNEVTGGLK